MMTDIVALADRECIREFLHRYCFALDRGSVDIDIDIDIGGTLLDTEVVRPVADDRTQRRAS